MMKTRQVDKWTSGQGEKFSIFDVLLREFYSFIRNTIFLSSCLRSLPSQPSPIFISNSGYFASVLIVSTLSKLTPLRVRLINPVSTLPGPTSTT